MDDHHSAKNFMLQMANEICILRDENAKLHAENTKLRTLLKECALNIESEINARYHDCNGKVHPALQRKYNIEMAIVLDCKKII